MSGIFDAPTAAEVKGALRRRAGDRLRALSDSQLYSLLAEAVYLERRRVSMGDIPAEGEVELIDALARALPNRRGEQEQAALALVEQYTGEVHNRFSPRTYNFATSILPATLTRLLTFTERPSELIGGNFDPNSRIKVSGPLDTLRALAKTHTLIVAPTHVSNMDSPLIGYALYEAGLPPVVYGAGLNLFENPLMAFFMSRLGAYTVDRRKKHGLYKDVLKDYSTEVLSRRCHSLFFPGGTRSRSGKIETKLKKGLLGTGLSAWQEGLATGREHPEILVVPCVLSCSLVLEAETLIEESLKEEGKQRYIISDDEFADTRAVANFGRKVLNLDASVHVRFCAPLDVFGNPVDDAGRSLDRHGEIIDRRGYVTEADGRVVRDEQRDHVYTTGLAGAIERSYSQNNTALATHVTAFAAWNLLRASHPRMDVFQTALLGPSERNLKLSALLAAMERAITGLKQREAAGRLRTALPTGGARGAMYEAVARFASFHNRRAVEITGDDLVWVDPMLALYYSNRLVGYGLEAEVQHQGGTP